MAEELSEFAKATADTEAALNNLQSSVTGLKKENWKVGLGMELSETDKDGYKSAIENFLSTSQTFIDDNHYQATVALKLLAGGLANSLSSSAIPAKVISDATFLTSASDREISPKAFFATFAHSDLGPQLTDSMNIALEDSVITLDEAAELESLQEFVYLRIIPFRCLRNRLVVFRLRNRTVCKLKV